MSFPEKKGDPRRPVIPINIGEHHFLEVLCDFGARVNIILRYFTRKFMEIHCCIQPRACKWQTRRCVIRKILEDIYVRVGQSYVPTDFVVIETGGDERAPIILGSPLLCTAKAIIYANNAKINFNIKGRKEMFTFWKNTLKDPTHPQTPNDHQNYDGVEIKKKNQRNRNRQPKVESVRMVTVVEKDHDHLLASPYLIKTEDPGAPTIDCTINQCSFQKAVCNTGAEVNIMAKVTYEFLYGKMSLHSTFVQLQMADETYRFPEGIAKDVPVQIDDHFIPTDFLVLDMGEEDYETPIILGRPFLNTTRAIIYIGTGEVHFQFPSKKVRRYFTNYEVSEEPQKNRSRRRRHSQRQKKQIPKDG